MRQQELVEILAHYADNLIEGVDETERLVHAYAEMWPELTTLLRLTQQLKEVLLPVAPAAVFTMHLHRRLLQQSAGERSKRRLPRPAWMLAATLGSLLSVAGLTWLVRRYWKFSGSSPTTPEAV